MPQNDSTFECCLLDPCMSTCCSRSRLFRRCSCFALRLSLRTPTGTPNVRKYEPFAHMRWVRIFVMAYRRYACLSTGGHNKKVRRAVRRGRFERLVNTAQRSGRGCLPKARHSPSQIKMSDLFSRSPILYSF